MKDKYLRFSVFVTEHKVSHADDLQLNESFKSSGGRFKGLLRPSSGPWLRNTALEIHIGSSLPTACLKLNIKAGACGIRSVIWFEMHVNSSRCTQTQLRAALTSGVCAVLR